MDDYLLRADCQPRGHFSAYINDRNWTYIPLLKCEVVPLANDRRVGASKPASMVVNKLKLEMVSLLQQDQIQDIQLPASKRPVLFYTARFAIQGQLHVRSDAPDEDLLDEMHDFYPVSNASIFPIRAVPSAPQQSVPLVFLSRLRIQAYRARPE